MSVTLSDLQTRLAYRLGEDSAPSDSNEVNRRKSFFNEAQRKALGEYYWWFLEDQKSTTSVDAQEIYSLDSTFREMIELRVDGDVVTPIAKHDAFATFDYPPLSYQYESVTPNYYIFGDNELHLLPIPSSAPSAVAVTSITQTAGVATVTTTTAHGYFNHGWVTIAGATPTAYNGEQHITSVADTTHFTFSVASATTSPATGTITATERNIVYRFWKLVVDLSDTTDTISLPDRYADALIAYAFGRKVGTVEGMEGTANNAFAEFNEIIKDMSAEQNRKQIYNKSVKPEWS